MANRAAQDGGMAKPLCSKLIWDRFTNYPCTRTGVAERNGKWFCKQHDPVEQKAKQDAKSAERREQWAREDAERANRNRIAQAERRVIEQARLWEVSRQPRMASDEGPLAAAVRALEAALKPEEGENA